MSDLNRQRCPNCGEPGSGPLDDWRHFDPETGEQWSSCDEAPERIKARWPINAARNEDAHLESDYEDRHHFDEAEDLTP